MSLILHFLFEIESMVTLMVVKLDELRLEIHNFFERHEKQSKFIFCYTRLQWSCIKV